MKEYVIAKEWSALLPGRRIWEKPPYDEKDGIFFFENVLEDFYHNRQAGEQLLIDFDGIAGYTPISFLDDAFGTFIRGYNRKDIRPNFNGYPIDELINTFQIKAIADIAIPNLFEEIKIPIKINIY